MGVAVQYLLRRTDQRPALRGSWDNEPWAGAEPAKLIHFLEQSPSRHPRVEFKALYDQAGIYLFYLVQDRYVRCVRANYQESVCKDSCVEFFVEPKAGCGYFNFEINCGGTLLLYFQEQLPDNAGYKRHKAPPELGRLAQIYHSMPQIVDPEIKEAVEWRIECFIPVAIFEHYLGRLGPLAGQTWRANFYKCGDETSHPHWASWAPMGPELNFHLPKYFQPIVFKP